MNRPEVVYCPRPDVTPEVEISSLAVAYRFILLAATTRMGNNLALELPEDTIVRNAEEVSDVAR
jgi:hypothetical protein